MRPGTVAVALLLTAALPALCGCSPEIQITGAERIPLTPQGRMAVLKVTARPVGKPISLAVLWGRSQAPRAETMFAEMLAHYARQECGLDTMEPAEVTKALDEADLTPTLDPDPKRLEKFAKELGCEAYLTAHVERCRSYYIMFYSWSSVRFVFSCRVPGAYEPLWSVQVRQSRRGVGHRVLAASALECAFRAVNAQRASPAREK